MSVLEWARWYLSRGCGVIPVRADGSKAPAMKAGEIEHYREMPADEATLEEWFHPARAVGVGILCGKISGNLAVIDIESESAAQHFFAAIKGTDLEAVVNAAPIVKTPKGGRHVYCRIAEGWIVGGVLARRSRKSILVEVRGQGHYVVAPGSPMACHELNVPYEFVQEGWLE